MSSESGPACEIPKSTLIDQSFNRLYEIGAIRAALELKVWEKIANGADSVDKIVSAEGWNRDGVQRLLDAMCEVGLLSREGEQFCLTPEADYYLVPGKPTYKGDIVLSEYRWDSNGNLANAIRSGKRPLEYDATKPAAAGLWLADYSGRWVYPECYLQVDDQLWRSIGIQGCNGLQVLDLACGPAPLTMALARAHPGVRLTWIDWENVLQTAFSAAVRLGISNQVSLHPGDLLLTDFGARVFDVIFLGNVTHFFNSDENIRLFRRVNAALRGGGTIVVSSVVRKEHTETVWADLWLYAATASGGAYDFNDYQAMLEAAGFTNIEDINQGPIRAVKP